jgi:hypothetical protein
MNAFFLDSVTSKDLLTIFSGLLTPLLAVIATYIAYQQWHTSRIKLQHDLYDRKYAVYAALTNFLIQTQLDVLHVNYNTIILFGQKVKESYFLFDPEVSNYLEEVLKKGMALCDLNFKLNDPRLDAGLTNDTRTQLASEFGKQLDWFRQQLDSVAREKFKKHLKLY